MDQQAHYELLGIEKNNKDPVLYSFSKTKRDFTAKRINVNLEKIRELPHPK